MRGWYGNKQAHSLASRGVRTVGEIKKDLPPRTKDKYWYDFDEIYYTEFPLRVFRCGEPDEKPFVRFYSTEEIAEGYCAVMGGEVNSEVIDMKKPLIINPHLEGSLSEKEINQLLKKLYHEYERNYKELEEEMKKEGRTIGEWKDLTIHDFGMRLRGDAWRPIIEYAMEQGYDGIITQDTNAYLTGGTISYIVWGD